MTARFLHNYPARNAVRIIRQNQKFAIVTSILQLLGIPVMAAAVMFRQYEQLRSAMDSHYHYSIDVWPYLMIGGFCLGVAVLMGMFSGIRAYEEEWNKTHVDMLYALPLSDKQRFFSDYLGGLGMYLIPYLVSVLLGWVIILALTPMVRSVNTGDAFSLSLFYEEYLLLSVGLLVLMWMYYTLSALTASCCGTLFENIYTNLLLNLLIPGTFAAVLAMITSNIPGIDFEYSWDFIGFTSPIGGLIYILYLISTKTLDESFSSYSSYYTVYAGERGNTGLIPAYLRWIAFMIVLTAVILILSWKLYQHRKAEQVGKPFIYIWIYYVILTAVTVCILCLFDADETAFAVILFSAIVYFIMEVIRKRGFKKFWMSVITYIVTVAVTLGLFFTVISTDCFGRVNYIPSLMNVTSAEIEFYTPDNSTTLRLTFTDKDTISKIQDVHRDYLENHDSRLEELKNIYNTYPYRLSYSYDTYQPYTWKETPQNDITDFYDDFSYYFENYQFTVNYYTLAGTTIHRNYTFVADEFFNLMQVCLETDAYAEAMGTLMKKRVSSHPEERDNIYHQKSLRIDSPVNDTAISQNLSINENLIQSLADAYQHDFAHFGFDNFCHDEILCYIEDMPVYASCTETLSLLRNQGFTEFDQVNAILSQISRYENKLNIMILPYEDYASVSARYKSSTLSQFSFYFMPPENIYEKSLPMADADALRQYFPELSELLTHARKQYISKENCYLMVINGDYYLIPPEYSDIVRKLTGTSTKNSANPDFSALL